MPWTMTQNVAQYQGANWDNYVKTVSNCSPAQAKLIAFQDPSITYFFYCRDPMVLTNGHSFQSGDAVFFNGTQKPWWGSAPQCDGYARLCLAVGYAGANAASLQTALEMTYEGGPALDAVIFTVNLNDVATIPTGYAQIVPSAAGPTVLTANAEVQTLLAGPIASVVSQAHNQGTAVLMCGLNNHDAAGWAEFQTLADAQQFAGQCATVLGQYGFDGVDIDDEYSTGTVNDTSLAMASYCVDGAVAPKTLSKALYDDTQYAPNQYENMTIFWNLTWGWTMSYGTSAQIQMQPYASLMGNNRQCCGFWADAGVPNSDQITWLYANGYAGVMVYSVTDTGGASLLNTLLGYWSAAQSGG